MIACLGVLMVMSSPLAQADPTRSVVIVGLTGEMRGADIHVSGQAETSDATATISGLAVTITVNDQSEGTVTTGDNGSFEMTVPTTGQPGDYTIVATWAGDTNYAAAVASYHLSVAASAGPSCESALTLTLDPVAATPGAIVSVNGSLTCGATAVSAAMIDLTSTYGSIDAMVATNDDGTYAAAVTLPEDASFPSGYTVTAAFSGDGSFGAARAQIAGTISAPPSPSPQADQSVAPSDPVASQSAEASVGTDGGSAGDKPKTSAIIGGANMALLGVLFGSVAILAVVTLLVLGVISHRGKRLSLNERRGFGTSFGKQH
jgi:hypothetical protein